MKQHAETTDDFQCFNLMQILGIDICLTAGVLFATLAGGMSLGAALLLAWIGGAALTIALVATVYLFRARTLNLQPAVMSAASPELVPNGVKDPLTVWSSDLEIETDHADRTRKPPQPGVPSRRRADRAGLTSEWKGDVPDRSEPSSAAVAANGAPRRTSQR